MYTRTVYLFPSALQALRIKADVKLPLYLNPCPANRTPPCPLLPPLGANVLASIMLANPCAKHIDSTDSTH
jgi:hypothetical protein